METTQNFYSTDSLSNNSCGENNLVPVTSRLLTKIAASTTF